MCGGILQWKLPFRSTRFEAVPEQPLDDLITRLERERLAADRRYNDALTALDRAIQRPPALPESPPPYDDRQVTPVNDAGDILPEGPPALDGSDWSLRGRLRAFVWRLAGPPLERQKRFNAALVDHLNRNVRAHQAARQALTSLLEAARREFEALARFESLLLQYLQTITAYVDTKDRRAGGADAHERLALVEQRVMALKRSIEGGLASPKSPAGRAGTKAEMFGGDVDSTTYVAFEDRFRGTQEEIRGRVDEYLPILGSATDVLDVGCGRGELLDLLKQRGVSARGIDANPSMVELCRGRGLDVERADALSYLERQADASIGGLVAIQVVEHFEPAYLLRFLEAAHHKLRPGAPLVLETINAACWMAFFECYLRDLTHQRPLHPDTLRYLVRASGFANADVRYRAPVRDADRLERVAAPSADAALASVVSTLNAHADKLNARLFSSMDYVVIARR